MKKRGCVFWFLVIMVILILAGVYAAIKPMDQTAYDKTKKTEKTATTTKETLVTTEETTGTEAPSDSEELANPSQTDEQEQGVTEEQGETRPDPGLSYAEYIKMFKNGDFSLVTPELKEEMDAYEEFYDKYIELMGKYLSGKGNYMQMLEDYTKMMEDVLEWDAKIEAVDESKLNSADDAYYLFITERVMEKLLTSTFSVSTSSETSAA